jgi:hypothetical protein
VKAAVAPTLFSIKSVLAHDFPLFLDAMLEQGAERLSILKRKLISTTEKEQLYYDT